MSDTSEIRIYGVGIVFASVCAPASMEREEIEKDVTNQISELAGEEITYVISKDPNFATGEPNPCQCKDDPDRKHWLLNC